MINIKSSKIYNLLIIRLILLGGLLNIGAMEPPIRSVNPKIPDFKRIEIGNTAELAARHAGEIIRRGSDLINLRDSVSEKGSSRDIVTKYDKECQAVIQHTIRRNFPSHTFLGEEDVEPGIDASRKAVKRNGEDDDLWIVDPIDGTTNFAYGMSLSGGLCKLI